MTIHCHGETHGFVGASRVCVCGKSVLTFNGYHPSAYIPNPHHPRASQPTAEPEIPARRLALAKRAGASHVSKDGDKAFMSRFGEVMCSDYDGWNYGAWWPCDGLPGDAVKVEG